MSAEKCVFLNLAQQEANSARWSSLERAGGASSPEGAND
jgi:hypothetical protein